jgi:hypothetical protein
MARPSVELVAALRTTASRLSAGAAYQWGHLGQCNCGHLVQTVCRLDKRVIHEWALEGHGDWEQLANDYCPTSGHHIDDVITSLLDIGLDRDDIGHLEKVDDPHVLAAMGRYPRRNVREDVVEYLRVWASLLEAQLPAVARAAA